MRCLGTLITVLLLLPGLFGIVTAAELTKATPVDHSGDSPGNEIMVLSPQHSPDEAYQCRVRVYIVEPESRYIDFTNYYHYDFGFLGFALDTTLSLGGQETYQETITWSGPSYGFSDITGDNIMAIAVVFNVSEWFLQNSDPYSGDYPFFAFYTDAAAAATPGTPGYDTAYGIYTHTVFVEEGTKKNCEFCPVTRQALKNIYEAGNHNFLYAAMVISENGWADDWMGGQYNLAYTPSCYFDGGQYVGVGGQEDETFYTDRIEGAGQREVQDLDLDVSMTWDFYATSVDVTVTLTNNETANSAPDTPSLPSGPSAGLLEDEHTFSFTPSDPDGDHMSCQWDWGEIIGGWLGPYDSGVEVTTGHTWSTVGTYAVAVKVKDEIAESAWSESAAVKIVERGDANGNFAVEVGDVLHLISYIFKGGPDATPHEAGDANCDGEVNIGDPLYLIDYIWRSGSPPGCP